MAPRLVRRQAKLPLTRRGNAGKARTFELTVSRPGYEPLRLNLGDPRTPTQPVARGVDREEPVDEKVGPGWAPANGDVAVAN
ncbi:MAG: hypothetical protein VX466_03505 [Myxococcota bacterium]|nr:hypothetical protein [Myxococcota bacterium]